MDIQVDNPVSWFRDAIVYHVLIDRFAGYDPKKNWQRPIFTGGNLQGISDHIPYLFELGINTLWISPINKTTSYHGYHITDYFSTDPHFGTMRDLQDLVNNAHRHNIRVILDYVPNHCSYKHPFFRKALQNKKSPYRKWFYFDRNNGYRCFLHFKELPKLNLDHPEARNHIISAAKYWLALGIDGLRLDHAIGPSHDFWKVFRKEIKSAYPNTVMIAEAWLEGISLSLLKTIGIRHKYLRWIFSINSLGVQREYIGEMDGALDFYFRNQVTELIAWKDEPACNEEQLMQKMMQHYRKFPADYFLPSFVENHDMNRFLYEANQDRDKLKHALKIQFSLPQPPILYYGCETGLTHEKPVAWDVPFSDLVARRFMPWDSLDQDMIGYCKALIRKRKSGSPG